MVVLLVALALGPGNAHSDYFAQLQPTDFKAVRAIVFSTPQPSGDAGYPTGMVRATEPNIANRIPANKWLARLIMASDASSDKFHRVETRIVVDLSDGNRLVITRDGIAQLLFKGRPKTPATFELVSADAAKFGTEIDQALKSRG